MPLPEPHKNESRQEFVSRCMGDETMLREYTENDQRAAVCYSQWSDSKKAGGEKSRMNKSRMKFEIKDISASGEFEGLLSPYGNVDGGNDVVEKGAYTKTLKEKGNRRPLLWQHKSDVPIGELMLEDRSDGLWCKGRLLMDSPNAQEAYRFIKQGIVKGLSVGFEMVKRSFKDNIRHLEELKLYEGSIVTFPMNESALIASVKAGAEGKGDFNEELSNRQTLDAWYQMQDALWNALCSALYSSMTNEEKLSAADSILQQYSDAFLAFLPGYLDVAEQAYGPIEMWAAKRILERKDRKAAMAKTVDGAELTADCFAYVGDPEDTSTWKLPIKFPGDEDKTAAHIRNALARFDQTDIPDSERPAVLAKIHAAAKKHGIDVGEDGKAAAIVMAIKAISSAIREMKSGKTISAATSGVIRSACEALLALLDSEAGDDPTSEGGKAARPSGQPPVAPAEQKSEPEADHSAAESLSKAFEDLRSLIPA